MRRRGTLNEMLWPETDEDVALAKQWAEDVGDEVLDLVWRGYDALRSQLSSVDLSEPPEQLERNLTSLHFREIQRLWKAETEGYASFSPTHENPELETRSSASAKPPAYDLGFSHFQNPRWQWPVEAKVLVTGAALAEYLKDVREKFLAGIAAPWVGEAAMIAYLLSGTDGEMFAKLAKELGQDLEYVARFSGRPHKCSSHSRRSAPNLVLHHLAMSCIAMRN